MSGLKEKIIKALGGFTEAELENFKTEKLLKENLVVHKKIDTCKLGSQICINAWERLPEDYIRNILAERLTEEIEKYMSVKTRYDELTAKCMYMGELEVVVRAGVESCKLKITLCGANLDIDTKMIEFEENCKVTNLPCIKCNPGPCGSRHLRKVKK